MKQPPQFKDVILAVRIVAVGVFLIFCVWPYGVASGGGLPNNSGTHDAESDLFVLGLNIESYKKLQGLLPPETDLYTELCERKIIVDGPVMTPGRYKSSRVMAE